MSGDQNWVEALNINPENLSQWSEQVPAGKPILVWCLEENLVSVDDYLAWASRHFGLPVLDVTFFHGHFDPALLESSRQSGAWSPWRYPVEVWEGVTLVACVEPPAPEDRGEFLYVLADPSAMREAWGPAVGTTFTQLPSDLPPIPSAVDAPIGLSEAPPAFTLNLDDHALFGAGEPAAPSPAPAAVATPAPTPVSVAAPASVTASAPIAVPVSAPVATPVPTSVAAAAPIAATTPPPAPTATPAPALAEDEVVPHEETQTASAVKPKGPPAMAKPSPSLIGQGFEELLTMLSTRYQAAFVLRCLDGLAKLYQIGPGMQVASGEPVQVNLSYPTFLRIVTKTQMPYHGYLVDSPAHQELFAALGWEKLPLSVTAVPIKVEGVLWGIAVGIGDEEAARMETLHFMQEHVDDAVLALSEKLVRAA